MSNNSKHEPGPDLCIAFHGEYKCEKLKGHDGPHQALKGEIKWDNDE